MGLPNKSIAKTLDAAEGTVKLHVAAILHALGARNRTQAVTEASRLGWLTPYNQNHCLLRNRSITDDPLKELYQT